MFKILLIDGKCLFLCYQPKIPTILKRKVKY
ncbi:AgrD family cyclic lactone autoinducer peptide [Thomasclavelia spiroformis]|nr:cyclic lactone autoinducer peptide [Thomasclavelia spiroformis]